MFCSNCGKDCGEAKFCSECGQDLRTNAAEQSFEDRKKQLQAEGQIYCPKCLSTNYTTNKEKRRSIYYLSPLVSILEFVNFCMSLRTKRMCGIECVCLQCGNSWFPKVEALNEKYKKLMIKPLEGYPAIKYPTADDAYMQLEENRMIIFYPKKRDYIIPFTKIVAVNYEESMGAQVGIITIRDRSNKYRSFPKTLSQAKRDSLTLVFKSCYSDAYSELYVALLEVVEENRKAGLL